MLGNRDTEPQALLKSRPRRNPRPINSCTECRLRKSRCSKSYPCHSCTLYNRNCVYLRVLPSNERANNRTSPSSTNQASISNEEEVDQIPIRDYDWAHHQQNLSREKFQWNHLMADPQAMHDANYQDSDNDENEMSDTVGHSLQIGRMILTERIGGFFRPHYAKELGDLLSSRCHTVPRQPGFTPPPNLKRRMDPNPPTSCFSVLAFPSLACPMVDLPHWSDAEILYEQYLLAVNPIAHVLHIPTFKRIFDSFWITVKSGGGVSESKTALIMAVCMSAAASMSPMQAKSQFGIDQNSLYRKLQTGAELALMRANFTSSSSIQTIQALTIYLVTECRAEVSRSHSVLVGALIRLAQCVGMHRDSTNKSLSPLQRQIRSLIWYHICYLDLKTAEAQGPQPTIRADDFDIPMPCNVDDTAFEITSFNPVPVKTWTDCTFALIRFEITELHRLIFRSRIQVDRGEMLLNELKAMVESREQSIIDKYLKSLDMQVPVQRCAHLVANLLMARCDSMIFYRHLPKGVRTKSENRLRDILVEAALVTLESGATLESAADLAPFAWYAGAYQQYHTVLLLLTERYKEPEIQSSQRIGTIIDHVFGHCYGISLTQRCEDILWMIKEGLESFYSLRKVTCLAKLPERDPEDAEDNNAFLGVIDGQTKLSEAEIEDLMNSFQQVDPSIINPSISGMTQGSWPKQSMIGDPLCRGFDHVDCMLGMDDMQVFF